MGDVRRDSETRRSELTDAALHIIATKGISALTTRSLAAHVGLSSGAMFRHFASLDALLEAVVDRVEAVLDATIPTDPLPPLERLDRFVDRRSTAVGKQLGIVRLVLSEQFLLALPKGASERLQGCVQRSRAFIARCLRDGQASGVVRGDVPALALVPVVMGTTQQLALSSFDARERASVRKGLLTLLGPPVTAAPKGRRKSA